MIRTHYLLNLSVSRIYVESGIIITSLIKFYEVIEDRGGDHIL